MSDKTPRTDAAEAAAKAFYDEQREIDWPPFDASVFDIARQLEEELAEARAALAVERDWVCSVNKDNGTLIRDLDAANAKLAAANRLLDEQAGYASDADRYQRELAALKAAVEKLAGEFDRAGSVGVVVNGAQFAAELRELLK